MKKKRASEIFRLVDPHLRVIDGGTHRKRHLTKVDWDKTNGVICPNCEQETLRMVEGICIQCYRDKVAVKEERLGRKREKRYLVNLFNKGKITLRQMREGRLQGT